MFVAGDSGFNIAEKSAVKDLEMLEQARRKFDESKKSAGSSHDAETNGALTHPHGARFAQSWPNTKGGAWQIQSAPKGGM